MGILKRMREEHALKIHGAVAGTLFATTFDNRAQSEQMVLLTKRWLI